MVYKKLDEFPPKKTCHFCKSRKSDEVELGEICAASDIYCHYFCLLLSKSVLQRGQDNQGILGFLPSDIKKEVLRGKNVRCTYCKKFGATIECHDKKCKIAFHLPCAQKRGSVHQFYGHFRSFCSSHKPEQSIPDSVLETSENCVVCLNPVQRTITYIWPICCKPSALIHKRCLQRMALYHGYYFKCPLCNDRSSFIEEAKKMGIYIPEQDPTWEREEGAFQELLDRSISCVRGSDCACEHGPQYSRISTKWKLERCSCCGSCGIHLACSSDWVPGSGYLMTWECDTCSAATQAPATTETEAVIVSDDDEEEVEVDVETVDVDPPLKLPSSYFSINFVPAQIPEPQRCDPLSLNWQPNLPLLRNEIPIVISDSEEEEMEVISIHSSETESAAPGRSGQQSLLSSPIRPKVSEVIIID